jgi:hypothetical protein
MAVAKMYTPEAQEMIRLATVVIEKYEIAGGHIYSYDTPSSMLSVAEKEVFTWADPDGARLKALKAKWHIILAADLMASEEDAAAAGVMAEAAEAVADPDAETMRQWAEFTTLMAKNIREELRKWLSENRQRPVSLRAPPSIRAKQKH